MTLIGVGLFLSGLILLYLSVVDVPFGTIAKQVVEGQVASLPKKHK